MKRQFHLGACKDPRGIAAEQYFLEMHSRKASNIKREKVAIQIPYNSMSFELIRSFNWKK